MEVISRKESIERGLTRYFTGKPCKNGHISERVTKKCDCVECNIERNAAYRSIPENQEKAKARSKAWRDEMGSKEYYQYLKSIIERNHGSLSEYWKKYRINYPESGPKRAKLWAQRHPERKRNLDRQRKALLRNAEGTHTSDDVAIILEEQNFTCPYCLADISDGYHVDHYMPLALGGTNWPDNLQCTCPTCNMSKGAKLPSDWHKELWFFC